MGFALERACGRVIAAGAGILVALALLGADAAGPRLPGPFLAGALPVWAAVGVFLWRARKDNHRVAIQEGEAPVMLPDLGLPTLVTLARGLGIAAIAGFVALPRPGVALAWVPGLLYTAVAIADRYDGRLARRLGRVTVLGDRLDVMTDALGLLVAPLLAVLWHRLPPWYLLLSAAYYLFSAGLWLRVRICAPVYLERIGKNPAARFFAGCQMGLVAAALFPVLPASITFPAATVFMTPTLALFVRDWLRVTGRMGRENSTQLSSRNPT